MGINLWASFIPKCPDQGNFSISSGKIDSTSIFFEMFAFMIKPTFYHDSLGLVKLDRSDYDFITSEFVDSDSEKDYNHYYRIIGRNESTVFHSHGKSWPADFD